MGQAEVSFGDTIAFYVPDMSFRHFCLLACFFVLKQGLTI